MSIYYPDQWIKQWWDSLFIESCTSWVYKNYLNGLIEWIVWLEILSNILPELGPWARCVLSSGLALQPLRLSSRQLLIFTSPAPAQGKVYTAGLRWPVSLPGSQAGLWPATMAAPGIIWLHVHRRFDFCTCRLRIGMSCFIISYI